MTDSNQTPAVQSLLDHQSRQRARPDEELNKGLEDTFPASDPISATHTATVGARDENRENVEDGDYPLVDVALESTGEKIGRSDHAAYRTLVRDAFKATDQASELASGAVGLARAETRSLVNDVAARVRQRPLLAMGIVAALAYVWGATR